MKIIKTENLSVDRVVEFHSGVSNRILLQQDGMGYTMTKTIVHPGKRVFQHYKNHLESCYCVKGKAVLVNAITGEEHIIEPDVTYVLDKNDPHYFEAIEETTMICVFNPPLTGREIHQDDGSYAKNDISGFKSPVYDVRRVPIEKVTANDYNPNSVAPPEMALLETSIWEDGYTQPVVVVHDKERDMYVVVDGFHRYCTLRDSRRIYEREQGMLPVVILEKEMHDRMASTIRHNRARGSHNIELMSTIVAELVEMGKGDHWICKHIGMSPDELLRLKQITGVAALFQNQDFSKSWDVDQYENEADDD